MSHDPPSAAARRPSLDGVERVHRAPGRRRRPFWWRLWAAPLGLLGAVLALAVIFWDRLGPMSWIFVLASWLPAVAQVVSERRSWTALEDDGVRTSNGLTRARFHRWEDVSGVVVEGRFAQRSALRLRNGVEVPLPHVPADVAQHLRDELDPTPTRRPLRRVASGPVAAGPTGAGGPRPEDDLDMEGPFRRGPSRR